MNQDKMAIALSGGGVRAMAYHSGFLRYLAETKRLEQIKKISSVSGGSLLVGLIFKENDYRWPSSAQYEQHIFPRIKKQLTTQNLQLQLLLTLCKPQNWQYWFSRANVFALVIKRCWGIDERLSKLPRSPQWSINATTLENGCRFRFKNGSCGDYSLGYADSSEFLLANAMAMSAAIPGGIGPLVIKSADYRWQKKPLWYGPAGSEVEVKLAFKKLHICDGGVYDNLGIEPFFDSGKGKLKIKGYQLFVLDAGSPLMDKTHGCRFNPLRLKRIIDITMEQSRALRVRSFLNYLIKDKGLGGYALIGQSAPRLLARVDCAAYDWLSTEQLEKISLYPTHLKKVSVTDFDLIARHGYETAKALHLKMLSKERLAE